MTTRRLVSGKWWIPAATLVLLFLCSASLTPAQRVIYLGTGADPRISGDGRWVVMGTNPVILVRPDGTGATPLVSVPATKNLNSDGSLMVYGDFDFANGYLNLLNLTTMQSSIVATDPEAVEMPTISADGSTIVFWDSSGQLRAVNADGSDNRIVADASYQSAQGGPAVTADGSLAVVDAGGPGSYTTSNVYLVPTDSNTPVPLVIDDGKNAVRARISDDGGTITFEDYTASLYAADADGTHFRTLFAYPINFSGEDHDYSALSGSGGVAVFSSYNRVFVVRTDGTGLRQIAGGGGVVDIDAKGDVVVFSGSYGGMSGSFAAGVPWVSPSEVGPLGFDVNGTDLHWVGSPAANEYNLYRAALGSLSSGIAGDCLQGGLGTESATDTAIPPSGGGYAYIVTGENAAGNGDAGLRGDGTQRVLGVACPSIDSDGDGTPDASDVCPLTADPLQADSDGDGIGDACDNCVSVSNADQTDTDNDGVGDVCHCLASANPGYPDADGDLQIDTCTAQCYPVVYHCDNCPSTYNPDQAWVGAPLVQVTAPAGGGGPAVAIGSNLTIEWSATDDCGGVSFIDIFISRTGPGGPFEPIVQGISNTGSYTWNVTGPATSHGNAFIMVTARDAGNNEASDLNDNGFTIN